MIQWGLSCPTLRRERERERKRKKGEAGKKRQTGMIVQEQGDQTGLAKCQTIFYIVKFQRLVKVH